MKALRLIAMCVAGLTVTTIAVVILSSFPTLSQGNVPASAQGVAFGNGGFEGKYVEVEPGRLVAPSWSLWYTTAWPDESYIAPPLANAVTDPVYSGTKAQHVYWQQYKNFDACLYQKVGGITIGHYVRFSAWGRVDTSMGIPDAQTRIGIDPAGGDNPLDIQYETHPDNWDVYDAASGEWQRLSVAVKATAPTVTVYACAHPRWAMEFHVYWDDAEFTVTPEKLVYLPLVMRSYCTVPPGELWNPDLELDFCNLHGYQLPISGYKNVFVAPYWMPFWNTDYVTTTGENAQPEYNYTDRDYRVHSGQVAQQYGRSAWGNFEAGIYQVITGVNVSDTLRFTIWGMGWSANGSDDRYSDVREGLNFRVGIDPYGGESYTSTNIVWSEFYDPYDEWHLFAITATARYTRVSVWAYAHPAAYWARYNQVFWDDADLTVVEQP